VLSLLFLGGCLGKPSGAGNTPDTSKQAQPELDTARGVYVLPSVAAPGGSATAWAELDAAFDENTYPPLSVTFCARKDSILLTTEKLSLTESDRLIVWIDGTTVLLGETWLADLSGAGHLTRLPMNPWSGVQVSPDRTRLAFWGRIGDEEDSSTIGPQVYDLSTGKARAVKAFSADAWTFAGTIEFPPRVAWLDNDTLLFDGPMATADSSFRTAVFRCALNSDTVDTFREDAWQVYASGDGKYVSLAHGAGDAKTAASVINMADGKETRLDADRYSYGSRVCFSGDRFFVVDPWSAVGAGQTVSGVPVFSSSAAKSGFLIVDTRFDGDNVSYLDLASRDGKIEKLTAARLTTAK
jgi:hypothetical protein